MCGVKCITFSLWINILSVITEIPAFELELTPQKSVIHIGKDLELICRVNECPGNVTFQWNALMDKYLVGAYKYEHTVSTLLTRTVNDIGIVCIALCDGKRKEKTSQIRVFYGPGTITTSSNNPSVKLGEHLKITCHADGNPKPTILWFKEETEPALQSQNEELIINNASWSQAGWYRCNASNAVGSLQMRIKVTVLGPPNIPKIQLSHREDPKEGENITILCSSDDGSTELTLYRQSQSTESEAKNKSAVLLKIPSVKITDAGIYVCEAKNDFGSERSTINITVAAQHNVMKMPDLPVVILPTAGSVSLLTIAGLLIRYCRKKARGNSSNIILS
ncbi:carcinoembryonic antigen-related cell adhesion molecule 2 isoform X2 [Ctenopharyngodon idella]|uniref:carcinoembryonic antigen-related cell adhesion molecule 2 isoform X2 n=1 Tax=Ctenopharyngodon idella TaxID=7959 RepID=UPI0022310696|nr:carcinoembryonic antigen-related cell adhesion molecule 2 isoform X2 [Ctenopharyngodon idella]